MWLDTEYKFGERTREYVLNVADSRRVKDALLDVQGKVATREQTARFSSLVCSLIAIKLKCDPAHLLPRVVDFDRKKMRFVVVVESPHFEFSDKGRPKTYILDGGELSNFSKES